MARLAVLRPRLGAELPPPNKRSLSLSRHARLSLTFPALPSVAQNRKNTPERLELMKYNPNLRRYTLHKEVK